MKKWIVFTVLLGCLVSFHVYPVSGETGFREALHLYYQGDVRKAILAFREVIVSDPENAAAYYYLGYAYQDLGDFSEARKAFRKTYEIDPNFLPDVKSIQR